jgi:hypothetical protein
MYQIALALLAICFGGILELFTLPLRVQPSTGNPVALRGTATAVTKVAAEPEDSFTADVLTTNVSDRKIVLVIIQLHLKGFVNADVTDIRAQDFYFEGQPFEPKSTTVIHGGFPFVRRKSVNPPDPASAKASAKVVYVQFADGSSWGDAGRAREIMEQREYDLNRLRALEQTFRLQGSSEFVSKLLETSGPAPFHRGIVNKLRSEYLTNKSPEKTHQDLLLMIENAELYESAWGTK